jgi:hypothetical protein
MPGMPHKLIRSAPSTIRCEKFFTPSPDFIYNKIFIMRIGLAEDASEATCIFPFSGLFGDCC